MKHEILGVFQVLNKTIGSFSKEEDIMKVPGIKEGAYQKLKDKICVD